MKTAVSLLTAFLLLPLTWATLAAPVPLPIQGPAPEPSSGGGLSGNNSTENPENETQENNGNHGNHTGGPDNKTKDDHGKGGKDNRTRGLDVTPEKQNKTTLPGAAARYLFFVFNTGEVSEDVVLSYQENCGPGWSASLSRESLRLDPGEDASFVLNVTAPLVPTKLECVVSARAASADHLVWDYVLTVTTIILP